MKCVMSRGIYLRADGRLPCYCGAGETITLGRVPVDGSLFDFAADHYFGGPFTRIRESMAESMVPHPGVCDQCTYLDLDKGFESDRVETEIDWFHWEPSSRCMLDCAWCREDRRIYDGSDMNRTLPYKAFERLVKSLGDRGLSLNMGNICGVGEPTLNPDVWRMVRLVRDILGGDILLSTNGNGPYSEEIVPSGLTKLKIAVDAVDQRQYETYRKHGRLEKALAFTRKVAEAKQRLTSSSPAIIWQYILFNYNDSDAELETYQKMALDHGVDRLRIVYTRCDNYSTRTPADFPEIFPNIDHFPIGSDSVLDVSDAEAEYRRIVSPDPGESGTARVLGMIRLINRIYHRLALGVETYRELLSFTKGLSHVFRANQKTLDRETFDRFAGLVTGGFRFLSDVYEDHGKTDQARRYRQYADRIDPSM